MRHLLCFLSLWLFTTTWCNAQGATYQSLAYETVVSVALSAATRRGEITNWLTYRETVFLGTQEQTNIAFVYRKADGYYTRVFVVKNRVDDSLVAYPEQKVTARHVYNAFDRYFDQVRGYAFMPKYEYNGSAAGQRKPSSPALPPWTIRVVEMGPQKRPYTARYHHMNPQDYVPEFTSTIRSMNRHIKALRHAMREHANTKYSSLVW